MLNRLICWLRGHNPWWGSRYESENSMSAVMWLDIDGTRQQTAKIDICTRCHQLYVAKVEGF